MKLKINATLQEFEHIQNLDELLHQVLKDRVHSNSLDANGVAVAVNHAVIPQEKWPETPLEENDNITILQAVQGG
jgi:sulfur carrier protein